MCQNYKNAVWDLKIWTYSIDGAAYKVTDLDLLPVCVVYFIFIFFIIILLG